jgi:hypothetical protein
MAQHNDREPNPQEAQRAGQGAISQDNPLRELHQEGEAANDRPIGSTPATKPGLTDEEVSVLCDIERDGSTHPHKQPVLQHLREQGLAGKVIARRLPAVLRPAVLTDQGHEANRTKALLFVLGCALARNLE